MSLRVFLWASYFRSDVFVLLRPSKRWSVFHEAKIKYWVTKSLQFCNIVQYTEKIFIILWVCVSASERPSEVFCLFWSGGISCVFYDLPFFVFACFCLSVFGENSKTHGTFTLAQHFDSLLIHVSVCVRLLVPSSIFHLSSSIFIVPSSFWPCTFLCLIMRLKHALQCYRKLN